MGLWNYRVVRSGDQLKVFDVYYDSEGRVNGRSLEPSVVYGESIEELREQLRMIEDAFELPILGVEDFG